MPIKVTDYDWEQNESFIILTVGLKNCNSKNLNIVCTSSYLKVS